MFYSLFYELVTNATLHDMLDGYLTKFGFVFTAAFSVAITLVEYAVFYGLRSAAVYKMAKRQNIKNIWLAFMPCGCFYIIGKLQDDTTRSARRNPLWQYAALVSSALWLISSLLLDIFGSLPTLLNVLALSDDAPVTVEVLTYTDLTYLLNLFAWLFSVVFLISSIILYLNIFKAYAPEKAVKYSAISVAVDLLFDTPLFYAIFLFRIRNREKSGYARYAAARANFYRNPYDNYGYRGGNYGDRNARTEQKYDEPFSEFGSDDEPFSDSNGDNFGGFNASDNNRSKDNGDDLFS